MRPKLLNESMIRIIRKRKKLKTKYDKISKKNNGGDFYGVLVICIAIVCFYIRYIIYKFN